MTRVNAKAISVHLCLFVFVSYQNHQMQLVTLMWGVVCGIGWGLVFPFWGWRWRQRDSQQLLMIITFCREICGSTSSLLKSSPLFLFVSLLIGVQGNGNPSFLFRCGREREFSPICHACEQLAPVLALQRLVSCGVYVNLQRFFFFL